MQEQVVLVLEVGVDRAHGQPGPLDHVRDRGAVIALLGEDLDGGADDPVTDLPFGGGSETRHAGDSKRNGCSLHRIATSSVPQALGLDKENGHSLWCRGLDEPPTGTPCRPSERPGSRVRFLGTLRLSPPPGGRHPRHRPGPRLGAARLHDLRCAERRRLAGQQLRIGRRRRTPRPGVRGRGELRHRPLPLHDARAPTPARPSSRPRSRTALAGVTTPPGGQRASSAMPRPATPGSSARPATPPTPSSSSNMTDEAVGRLRRRRSGPSIATAGRLHVPADRLRADHPGLRRAVREGPPARRGRVAADRGPRPHLRLRLDRRGRHAAPGRRPGHPVEPRPHLRRRPAGRDEHLRAQHRDDARAGPGHRLLAVHRLPVPRGARAAAGPSRRPSSAPWRPPARPSPSPGSRSRSACRGCCSSSRPAIRSIGIAGALVVLSSVVYALTFLPAVLGMLGHRVNALVDPRAARPVPALGGRPTQAERRADVALGARRPLR